jgi:hypothetical protein
MNEIFKLKNYYLAILAMVFMVSTVQAQQTSNKASPWDRQVFFGEQHLHTSSSADAFAFGTRSTPDDAYNFAKGKPLTLSTSGTVITKSTPYDWIAVTDHAVYLGVMMMLLDSTSTLASTEMGKLVAAGKGTEAFNELFASVALNVPIDYMMEPKVMAPAWKKQVDAANRHYEPGEFTTLIAFEWTSQPNYQNLHHNVFFRDDVGPNRVFSSFDSEHREDLWSYQEYQRTQGHENFSIPHNSNVSNGIMFALHTSDGDPIDAEWAKRSALNSPAVEIIQTKGASETNPALSPSDEFADFEQGFKHLLASNGLIARRDHSFVRSALIDGVGFKEMIGVNPYKYGIVSGADIHVAASTNEEFNYHGAHGEVDNSPEKRIKSATSPSGEAPIMFGTAGTTGVWADENTRGGIFDGIKRKETYGTSGTLIRVRLFAGWNYDSDILESKDWVKNAYADGVPMGGDLPMLSDTSKAPTFIVWAAKDPESGNLDRIQIIKGWYDETGNGRQKVYDVAWSDGRVPAGSEGQVIAIPGKGFDGPSDYIDVPAGKLPPVGNTVNVRTATYTNNIGDAQLKTVWTDPDFDPTKHAVYYARVIEIPTPRWTTYDAVKIGVPLPVNVPATIQERAWTSSVWYTPESSLVKKLGFYPGLQEKVRDSNFDASDLKKNNY